MARGTLQHPGSVAADGRLLAYSEVGTNTKEDIWILPLEPEGEPRIFLQTPASEGFPALSPEGRLLAYQSDESGQQEVYLRSFPDGGSKVQVSAGGGIEPVWARSGKELFYRAPLQGRQRRFMVVDVSPGNPIRVSRGRGLFEDSYEVVGLNLGTPNYDVFPDGQHFVMVETNREASRITHFNVIVNWFEELKRLVPPK